MKKLIFLIPILSIVTSVYYYFILKDALVLLTKSNEWLMPPIVLSFALLSILAMITDLFYHSKLTFFFLCTFYCTGFFIGQDALWSAVLLWNRNYFIIFFLLIAYAMLLATVIYRYDRKMYWLNTSFNKAPTISPGQDWKQFSLLNKASTFLGGTFLLFIVLWVPYKTILVIGYLNNYKPKQIHAKVTGLGSTRGKYYYHRYWQITLDGGTEKFWVYAAANTEAVLTRKCSTSDPEIGSMLVINGREGIFGFSYDRLIMIRNAKGDLICP